MKLAANLGCTIEDQSLTLGGGFPSKRDQVMDALFFLSFITTITSTLHPNYERI